MVLSNVIVDVTIPCRSVVFGQSRAKVSVGFSNVRSLVVAAFDLVYCSLSVLRFVKGEDKPDIPYKEPENLTNDLPERLSAILDYP